VPVDNALKAGTQWVRWSTESAQPGSVLHRRRQEGRRQARFGGNLLQRETEAFYLEPGALHRNHNSMRINREEVFGRSPPSSPRRTYDEALALANDTRSVCRPGMTSLAQARGALPRNSQAGMVMVNLPTAGVDYHVPFGGRKGSSYGPREQGRLRWNSSRRLKTAYIARSCSVRR
jgi:aldehyde dehydrogenase (NAD+)